jgi:hypothetical protein
MGNVCAAPRETEKDKALRMAFEDIVHKNMEGVAKMQGLKTKPKTFAEFMNVVGKIEVKREKGSLTVQTLRLINSYRDQWVFIQLEDEWTKALKERRENLNNITNYMKIYNEDMKIYDEHLAKATESLLKEHGIKEDEYMEAIVANLSMIVENGIADTIWSYWAFKNSGQPKILSKSDYLKGYKTMLSILSKSKDKLKPMLPNMESDDEKTALLKQELLNTWLIESAGKEAGIKPEDFLLAMLDARRLEDSEVRLMSQKLFTAEAILMSGVPEGFVEALMGK